MIVTASEGLESFYNHVLEVFVLLALSAVVTAVKTVQWSVRLRRRREGLADGKIVHPPERFQHLDRARAAGLSDAEIVEASDSAPLDQAKQVFLRYVDECVAEVKVSSPVFSAARAALGDENLATVTLLVGHYMMTAQFLETFEVEVDDSTTGWAGIGR